MQMD